MNPIASPAMVISPVQSDEDLQDIEEDPKEALKNDDISMTSLGSHDLPKGCEETAHGRKAMQEKYSSPREIFLEYPLKPVPVHSHIRE